MRKREVHGRKYFVLFVFLSIFWAVSGQAAAAPAKNLIVMIMDGCGAEQLTLARWFKGSPLALDEIRTGAVKTFIADGVIADSAPAASAYATGVRSGGTMISVAPKAGTDRPSYGNGANISVQPRATVLEGARLLGKSTGIVVTSRISHATPGAYVAHASQRDREQDITAQLVHQNLDVVFGGGRKYLLPGYAGGVRQDRQDLTRVLGERNYQLVDTVADLRKITKPKVIGLFCPSHLEPEIDRPGASPVQPSLAAMTTKALEVLAANRAGFFLMVEGSQIDWACHANDPAHLLSDLLMFDQAVQVALEFAKQDEHTLVLALPDHNTGGMTIGNRRTDTTYTQVRSETLIAPFKKMQLSAAALWRGLGKDKTPERIKAAVQAHWAINLSQEEAQQILDRAKQHGKESHYALGEIICPKYTDIGWTTHGHTGGDVPLFAYGPERPIGLFDAPDIGLISARALGLDLEALTDRLFVEAKQAFPPGDVSFEVSDSKGSAIHIRHKNRRAVLPVNSNILILDGQAFQLEGVIVHIPETSASYLPLQAVHLIKGHDKTLPAFEK